jgi:hypothetical protein
MGRFKETVSNDYLTEIELQSTVKKDDDLTSSFFNLPDSGDDIIDCIFSIEHLYLLQSEIR